MLVKISSDPLTNVIESNPKIFVLCIENDLFSFFLSVMAASADVVSENERLFFEKGKTTNFLLEKNLFAGRSRRLCSGS